MIIGVLNQKGGVGKTTIAVNLAPVCAASGKRVLLVDADPQGSSLAWSAAREGDPAFTVTGMPKPTLIFANKMGGRRFIVTLWHRRGAHGGAHWRVGARPCGSMIRSSTGHRSLLQWALSQRPTPPVGATDRSGRSHPSQRHRRSW
jgi:hypothetical protein